MTVTLLVIRVCFDAIVPPICLLFEMTLDFWKNSDQLYQFFKKCDRKDVKNYIQSNCCDWFCYDEDIWTNTKTPFVHFAWAEDIGCSTRSIQARRLQERITLLAYDLYETRKKPTSSHGQMQGTSNDNVVREWRFSSGHEVMSKIFVLYFQVLSNMMQFSSWKFRIHPVVWRWFNSITYDCSVGFWRTSNYRGTQSHPKIYTILALWAYASMFEFIDSAMLCYPHPSSNIRLLINTL